MYKAKNKIYIYSVFVWTLWLILSHNLVRWLSVFGFFYDPFGWFNIAGYVWFVCVAVLSHSHYFIIFDLERIRCAPTSAALEWLHVLIHETTFTEDRGAPKSAGPVAIVTFATIVNPALTATECHHKMMKKFPSLSLAGRHQVLLEPTSTESDVTHKHSAQETVQNMKCLIALVFATK